MLEHIELKLLQANEVVFFQPNEIYVIVSGTILMKNHRNHITMPENCATFCPGEILNYTAERPIFKDLETWLFAEVECEIVVFQREYFKNVWRKDVQT